MRAGYVELVHGYVHSASDNSVQVAHTSPNAPVEQTVENAKDVLREVDDIILCTGFSPCLDFLEQSLLHTIGFDAQEALQPLLLHRDVLHPQLPGLYFVGMYRGPYFAVVELQAVSSFTNGKYSFLHLLLFLLDVSSYHYCVCTDCTINISFHFIAINNSKR